MYKGMNFIALLPFTSMSLVKFRLFYIDLDMIHSIPCVFIHINFQVLSHFISEITVFAGNLVDEKKKINKF